MHIVYGPTHCGKL